MKPINRATFKNQVILLSLLVLAFHGDAFAGAGDFSVRVETEKSEALLGDEITMRVVINQPKGENYSPPENPDFGKLRLLRKSEQSVAKEHDRVEKVFTFTLGGYELGEHAIPPIPIFSTGGDTGFKTDELKIRISGQLQDGEQGEMKDVTPPVKYYERTWLLLYIAGAAAAAVGLFFLIRKIIRKRRIAAGSKDQADEKVSARRLPHEVALEKLNALLAEELLLKGRYKEFHFRLSEIIREYAGGRFAFDSMELTTSELLSVLRCTYTAGLDLGMFDMFCRKTDLVKFAKHVPSNADISTVTDMAFAIIGTTAPVSPTVAAPDMPPAEKDK